FFVESSCEVNSCCGDASELDELSMGNVKIGRGAGLLKNVRQNNIICAIFNLGSARIRNRLIKNGVKFPGKTSNNCFFCFYILKKVPRDMLLASIGK
ncbi:MAG: hypothetical protein WCY36_05180, partial [Candidatus Omnitrophota bacterium]